MFKNYIMPSRKYFAEQWRMNVGKAALPFTEDLKHNLLVLSGIHFNGVASVFLNIHLAEGFYHAFMQYLELSNYTKGEQYYYSDKITISFYYQTILVE